MLDPDFEEEAASAAQVWAGRFLDVPLGRWLLAGVGLGAFALAAAQLGKARGAAFGDVRSDGRVGALVRRVGRVGLAARGIVFAIIGVLFLRAAWWSRAEPAGGLRAALELVAGQPLGAGLLLAVAAGLYAFGCFNLLKAAFHRLDLGEGAGV